MVSRPAASHRRVSCASADRRSDSELALDLAAEVGRVKARAFRKQEALRKSKEMLFMELCGYMGCNSEEAKKRLGRTGEEERFVLIKGFVEDWALRFHPLSARSVMQLVDEYLAENSSSSSSSLSSPRLFPILRKLLGVFQQQIE